MGGSDVGANGCAVGGDLLGVSGPQNPIFVHLGRETAQKRLKNGQRNGRVSAKPAATASPRGNKRSWGVTFPSDQASRRAIPARAREAQGPFYQLGSFRGLSAFISGEGSLNYKVLRQICRVGLVFHIEYIYVLKQADLPRLIVN
jgi:hypothetical protein